MTDLEITKLCAEAMGLNGYFQNEDRLMKGSLAGGTILIYDPLHDDAQCMAMVKKFDIVIEREKDNSFAATLFPYDWPGKTPTFVVRMQPDLNHVICEAVAKMQAAKAK